MKNDFVKELLNMCAVLLAITVVVASGLGAVNAATAPKIKAINIEKTQKAMKEIITDADNFEAVEYTGDNELIREVYKATKGGVYAGVCIKVAPVGFGGDVVTIVGVSAEDTVVGAKVITSSETPGLGSKASDGEWIGQFSEKLSPLTVVKNTAVNPGDIIAISGATITSKAVTEGVQSALDFAAEYNKEVQ